MKLLPRHSASQPYPSLLTWRTRVLNLCPESDYTPSLGRVGMLKREAPDVVSWKGEFLMYSRLARRAWSLLLLVGLLGMAASLQTSLAYPAPVSTEGRATMTLPASEANPSPSSVASLRTATASLPDPSTLLQTTLANSHTYTLTEANNHQTLSVQTGDTIAVQL